MPRVPDEIRQTVIEGLAEGLRRHLPGAVGLVAQGIPICLLAAFGHFALGMSAPNTTAGAGVGAVMATVAATMREMRRRQQPRQEATRVAPTESHSGHGTRQT